MSEDVPLKVEAWPIERVIAYANHPTTRSAATGKVGEAFLRAAQRGASTASARPRAPHVQSQPDPLRALQLQAGASIWVAEGLQSGAGGAGRERDLPANHWWAHVDWNHGPLAYRSTGQLWGPSEQLADKVPDLRGACGDGCPLTGPVPRSVVDDRAGRSEH